MNFPSNSSLTIAVKMQTLDRFLETPVLITCISLYQKSGDNMFNRFFTFPLSTINISNSKLNLVLCSISINTKGEDNGNPTSASLLPSVSTVLGSTVWNCVLHVFQDEISRICLYSCLDKTDTISRNNS